MNPVYGLLFSAPFLLTTALFVYVMGWQVLTGELADDTLLSCGLLVVPTMTFFGIGIGFLWKFKTLEWVFGTPF